LCLPLLSTKIVEVKEKFLHRVVHSGILILVRIALGFLVGCGLVGERIFEDIKERFLELNFDGTKRLVRKAVDELRIDPLI